MCGGDAAGIASARAGAQRDTVLHRQHQPGQGTPHHEDLRAVHLARVRGDGGGLALGVLHDRVGQVAALQQRPQRRVLRRPPEQVPRPAQQSVPLWFQREQGYAIGGVSLAVSANDMDVSPEVGNAVCFPVTRACVMLAQCVQHRPCCAISQDGTQQDRGMPPCCVLHATAPGLLVPIMQTGRAGGRSGVAEPRRPPVSSRCADRMNNADLANTRPGKRTPSAAASSPSRRCPPTKATWADVRRFDISLGTIAMGVRPGRIAATWTHE